MAVTYGDLDGDGGEEAAVNLQYSTGGTANWHYLHVYKFANGKPRLIGILRSGSRADGGLWDVVIKQHLLVLDFADGERRAGDCCSRGFIRVRYRLENRRFIETGKREIDSIRDVSYPEEKTGPQTVRADKGRIVYTDASGADKYLTSSKFDVEPSLSLDNSTVVFLRKPSKTETEIWTVGTNGAAEHRVYRGGFRWNGRSYSSSSIRSPQWSIDRKAIYFVTDFTDMSGALWRLNVASGALQVVVPDAVMYKVLATGEFKGYLIANQRTRSNRRSDGAPYTEYPYFLFTSEGKKVRLVGPDGAYIDSVVGNFDEQ